MQGYFLSFRDLFEYEENTRLSTLGSYSGLWVACVMDACTMVLAVLFSVTYESLYAPH